MQERKHATENWAKDHHYPTFYRSLVCPWIPIAQVQQFSSNVTKRSLRHALVRNTNFGIIRCYGSVVAFTARRRVSFVTR